MFGEIHHFSDELLAEFYQSLVLPAVQLMEQYINRRIADGAFRAVNPTVVVRSLVGTLRFYSLVWEGMLGGLVEQVPREELMDEMATLFLRGLQKDPSVGD
jgi:hypothetical protein